ncbi:PREDICTED: LOW QUALITY PROTEIN [Prunus dulcis]|uniref:PREDICTED: LOW QUALITY PROTEIN n=1 Tax=Prunus dulcis TaxID=3755 RepID=A0A5E4F9F1_PRUDU|nr:PREDICTED: LOW QUALITY PROTEIN [Prunus dulcis]
MDNLVNNGGDNPPAQSWRLRDYTAPMEYNAPSCIVLTPITHHFKIHPTTIQLLPSYHGKEEENLCHHLKTFFTICSTFNYGGVSEEQIRLRLFPFSLRNKATN